MEECEVKFLNIDPAALEKKILNLGGNKIFDCTFRRIVFDYPDLRLDDQAAWVRLRDEGDRVTLSFKQRLGASEQKGENDTSMLEHEVVVSNFDATAEIMRSIGLTDKFYQENRRVQYKLGEVELDVDYWPELKPYLEIEAPNWELVDSAIEQLGLDHDEKRITSTHQLYEEVGINENDYKSFTFNGLVKR